MPSSGGAARWAPAALAAALLATRVPGLATLPIFMDESVHVCWAARLAREPGFLKPLEDGKLLQVAIASLLVPRAADPLWAARLASVLAGLAGALAVVALGRRLYGPRTGLVAGALWLACPFTLVYDRMALADVYLASSAALVLACTVRLCQSPSPGMAVALAASLAAAVLSKAPGLMVLAFPAAGALLLGRSRGVWPRLALAYGLGLAAIAPPAWYFFRHTTQLEAKAALAGVSRLALFRENITTAAEWLWGYWTPPLCIAALLAAAAGLRRGRGAELLLCFAVLLPVLPFALIAYDWFPRYILLATPPALVLAARALDAAARRLEQRCRDALRPAVLPALVLAALLPALRFDALWLRAPETAPLPGIDAFQYVWGWPSGYGWDAVIALLREERARHPEGLTVVADAAARGAGRWALRAAFVNDPGVLVQVMDVQEPAARRFLDEAVRSRPTFVAISSQEPVRPTRTTTPELLGVFRKPNRLIAGRLYRMRPKG